MPRVHEGAAPTGERDAAVPIRLLRAQIASCHAAYSAETLRGLDSNNCPMHQPVWPLVFAYPGTGLVATSPRVAALVDKESACHWAWVGNCTETATPSGPDDVVAPDERLSWGKTVGLGAQHVVAMFGATFVFPLIMGLNPQLAIMMSGIATICFLLIVAGQGAELPRHVGRRSSAASRRSAPRAATPPRSPARSSSPAWCSPSSACSSTSLGSGVLHKVLPPVVTGAVVMLIGFNLAPVVATIYWPQDQWVALATMVFMIVCAVAFRGLHRPHRDLPRPDLRLRRSRGSSTRRSARSPPSLGGATEATDHFRTNFAGRQGCRARGSASRRRPTIARRRQGGRRLARAVLLVAAILLVLPAVIALIAENTGHVKAVAEMTGHDLDPVMGRAIAADGIGTVLASVGRRLAHDDLRREHRRHGGDPGLLDGRLLRRRVVAILFGLSPEVRRARRLRPRRRARRDHRRALRHDRPARRQDLEGERGRLRQPDQPGADRRRHHHRHRQRVAEVHRQTSRSPASRSAPSWPSSATTSPRRWRPPELRDARRRAPCSPSAASDTYGDSDGIDDLYQGDGAGADPDPAGPRLSRRGPARSIPP